MKIKIIFLDIDGVLNSHRFYNKYSAKELMAMRDGYGDAFDDKSAKLLNKLIKKTGAYIVVSSTWRLQGLKAMREMWAKRGMGGNIIGVTPNLRMASQENRHDISIPRGCEIKWYYNEVHNFIHWGESTSEFIESHRAKSTLASYVVLDDDVDMLFEQRNNFVQCNENDGFTEKEYELALKILNTKLS